MQYTNLLAKLLDHLITSSKFGVFGPLASKNLTKLDSSSSGLCCWSVFFKCIFVPQKKLRKCGDFLHVSNIYQLFEATGGRWPPKLMDVSRFSFPAGIRRFRAVTVVLHGGGVAYPTILYYTILPIGSNHLLRMVLEPKYLSEEVIKHPNHYLTRWLDP